MSEEFELELNFPANVKIRGKNGKYNAVVVRKIDDKTYPVAALKDLTASECYTRLGAKVPKPEVDPVEGIGKAKKTLTDALTSLSGRTMINSAEVQDTLLDAINELGLAEDEQH
jgi:hypothetical protein